MTSDALPIGWSELTLDDVCSSITDGTHYTPKYVDRGGVPFYSVESVTNGDFRNVKQISVEEHRRLIRRCRPERGDILMTRIGSLAETKYVDWNIDASIYVSLALLKPGRTIDGRFLYAYTKSREFVRAVEDRSLLWAAPKKINMGDIGGVPIRVPDSIAEQRAIAEILFDLEEHVGAVRALLAKKQSLKQAMEQQLLTGRTRLPGFTDPWSETTLGKIARVKTGSRNNQDKVAGGRYPFFVRSATVESIDSYSYDCEAILVPGEGGIGSIFHYVTGKFEVHQRVYKVSDFLAGTNGKFVFHYMRQFFGAHAMENSVKATVDSLRLPTFTGFAIRLPSFEEQQAIVDALDEVQSEIAALERRLFKARDIKTGAMQELLSGRTRVPVEEAG